MFLFILSLLCASGLFITFKMWDRFNVDPFPATVINYLVSGVVAFFLCSPMPSMVSTFTAPWIPFAIALGCVSLIDFNLNSFTTKKLGVGYTVISSKISLVLPVTLAIVLFAETVTAMKIVGVISAITALVLISIQKGSNVAKIAWKRIYYFLPLLVFIGSGINDFLMLSLGRANAGSAAPDVTQVAFAVFTMAFLAGIVTFLALALAGKMSHRIFLIKRNIIGGTVMGLISVACFSFYMMGVGQLTEAGWDGSVLVSIYAVGILTLSVLTGIVIFHERFSRINYIGMVVALCAIIILSLNS